jgi:acetoin utilization deacetylase AcuC-like enzyme
MSVAIITHAQCLAHDLGSHHPEQPARLSVINDQLISSGLSFVCPQYDSEKVTKQQLLTVHDKSYIESLIENSPIEGVFDIDGDTHMMSETLSAAQYAAGAGIMGIDLIMQSKHRAAFCPVRPPGHHAEKNKAMGFCFFNNVALAAKHAIDKYNLQRVAIIDFDVHHGNGTQNIFEGDSKVLFCSSFQHPFYPFSGTQKSASNIINLPLPATIKSDEYREAVTQWFSAIDDFAPELIIISAGFDGHIADDMSSHSLIDQDYNWLTCELVALADKHCDGRILSMLEGGYAVHALGRTVIAHLKGLLKS